MIFVLFDIPSSDSSFNAERQIWIDVTQVEAIESHRTFVDGSIAIATRIRTKAGGCYTVAMDPSDVLAKIVEVVNDLGNYDEPVQTVST